MKFKSNLKNATAIGLALSAMSLPAFAQDADDTFTLEEINVSARKTESSIQDTSIAITAFSTEQMKDAGFNNIVDVAKAAPGLFLESYNDRNARTSTSPRFRGITVDNSDPLLRTASVFIDGIYVSGGIQSIGVQELQRVEIIKGPQSALFGRNTFAGAINYVTRDPSEELRVSTSMLAASRDEYRGAISIEGALSETLRASLNASYNYQGGHYENSADPTQELGRESTWSVSGTLLFEPNENFRLKARANYYEDDDGPGAVQRVGGYAMHNFGGFPEDGGTTERAFEGTLHAPDVIGTSTTDEQFAAALAAVDRMGGATSLGLTLADDLGGFGLKREASRFSTHATYNFDSGIALDMILGYNKEEYLFMSDFDSTADNSFAFTGASDTEDLTIEARVSGSAFDERLNWTVGGNYLDIEILSAAGFYDALGGFWFAGVVAPATFTGAKTKGLFAMLDYQISDEFKVIVEGRYQEDEISRPGVNAGLATPISPGNFNKFLPRIVFEYSPSDDTMVYANYSIGNLPGGFNSEVAELDAVQLAELEQDQPGLDVTFSEEKLENYELGLKHYFNDKQGLVNVAAFHMKRSDQIFSGFAFVTETDPNEPNATRTVAFTGNGATTDIWGTEIEAAYNFTQEFSMQATLSYIDAKIASFPDDAGSGDFGDVYGADADVTGQEAPRFPKWSWSLTGTYEKALGRDMLGIEDASFFARSDLYYTGGFWDSNTNLARTPVAYDLNFRTGIRNDDVSVEFFVTNLLGEDAPMSANNIADTSFDVRLRPGGFFWYDFTQESIHLGMRKKRQFGVRMNYSF